MNMHVAATKPAPRKPCPDQEARLNNLAMPKEAQPLYDAVVKQIEENVTLITEEFFKLGEGRSEIGRGLTGQVFLWH